MSSRFPDGYVERAVAELLASSEPPRRDPATTALPFRACPGCGASLADPGTFVQEYWVARETRFMVWCRDCHGTYTVVPVERYEGHEALD